MIKFIQNTGDFFAANYFDEDFTKKVLEKTGYAPEDIKEFIKRITALKDRYFKFKQAYLEENWRTKDKITETHRFHTDVLNALGYSGSQPEYQELFPVDEKTVLPVRHTLYRGDKPFLMIMEMRALIKEGEEEPDGLFEQQYHSEEQANSNPAQKYHRSQWENVFKVPEGLAISPMIINKAVSELFLLDQHRRPSYILLCAGNVYYLLEQEKWFRGSYLSFDLEELFSEGSVTREYYALFYFLLAKEALAPQSEIVLMDQLDEDSHKSAYEVTQDLKEGVIHAVEALANEAVYFLKTQKEYQVSGIKYQEGELGTEDESTTNSITDNAIPINADILKNECLNYVYRLLFLFYAESRNDLDILPADDAVYQHGYSLEMLRDLEQVPLNTASSQNGFFFHESLTRLFELMSTGYREKADPERNRSFRVRHLDSPLFDDSKLEILPHVKIRNLIWQDVICQLSLSRKQKGKARGRISYANLGINQLGSVYESLLAFRGFFAETDTIEVHRKRKDKETSEKVARMDGSYLVPRHRIDDFDRDEVYRGKDDRVKIIPQGTFIYRLSGRDRQKSASYYTPEVLTECTVKYTLKPILERLDQGEMKALDLLDLKILEPAMGAAAFHNEVINQLAEAYLSYRQEELKKKVAPDKYREELQKIKAYIALNNVYGVDLNPTAVELGKLSLWLNVIHQDMQTPFFGYRLGVGNAVVGAWLKVFPKKEIIAQYPSKMSKPLKKEWWDKAPEHIKIGKRNKEHIYHFLLPDKNMVPSAGIKLLKEAHPEEAKFVSEWKKRFCEPISESEFRRLQYFSVAIDRLLEEHYQFQASINAETKVRDIFFGAYDEGDQVAIKDKSYSEKEKLAKQRGESNAPYYKLKMIMDYWCSLWFWDMRQARQLPTRREWLDDIEAILNMDLDALEQTKSEPTALFPTEPVQTNIFGTAVPQQLTLQNYGKTKTESLTKLSKQLDKERVSLFTNSRSQIVQQVADQFRFFHYQLEFIEVFKEREGFDVIVGNPPWISVEVDETGITSEKKPEVLLRNYSAPQTKEEAKQILYKDEEFKTLYFDEIISINSLKEFIGSYQNYPLLAGQRNNLYKCILCNSFIINSKSGLTGLIHPSGHFEDPKAGELRRECYYRLNYNFQFLNTLKLFSEILHWISFDLNIYGHIKNKINFISIGNLFHPITIQASEVHNGEGVSSGLKIKDNSTNSFDWNISPHKNRLIPINESVLKIINKFSDDENDWERTKLTTPFSIELINAIEKITVFGHEIRKVNCYVTMCWNETNSVQDNFIKKQTDYVEIDSYKAIYSGPHFYVSNPISKSPHEHYSNQSHYDSIFLDLISEEFTPRFNYQSLIDKDELIKKTGLFEGSPWIDQFKLGLSKMVNPATERTLQPSILLPKTSHIDGVISVVFKENEELIQFTGLLSSIVYDFQIKVQGKTNIYDDTLSSLKTGISEKFKTTLYDRTLLLNCLNKYYAPLWERHFKEEFTQDTWTKEDARLKPFASLTPDWNWHTPLRNWFERRQALVEIDVITAMALGLTLEELILIYNVQFPVLQQNEDDTWYDQRGNIVFTCSKGLTGVGLDRKEWDEIKDMKAGETYEHTITKSELYQGKKVVYYAPFDKCDRVEDYKRAWGMFEGRFG
ncbi:hypothetical protein J0A68_11085 [Algoriphagus sp. H41]|uniref:site-specific DNA-methyltransferase (adenine-specific) n=1 Tax=Algoriphagus oliviformis TaxID=2811231 RepID=A0ABS3C3G6_9BACT|nr:hypothetical protein [Algoriphagus oliviformis]MBN7811502.1 hypothetical protein [Algoriphagus oliviformis]